MTLPKRKPLRLSAYDYSAPGAYFVTVCTRDRAPLLGHVGKAALRLPQVELTDFGRLTEMYIRRIPEVYPGVCLDAYVIMPNHVHLLLILEDGGQGAARPTVSTVVRSVKAMVRKETGRSLFQTSFYDHVIRGREDLSAVREYILNNPARWAEDRYYVSR